MEEASEETAAAADFRLFKSDHSATADGFSPVPAQQPLTTQHSFRSYKSDHSATSDGFSPFPAHQPLSTPHSVRSYKSDHSAKSEGFPPAPAHQPLTTQHRRTLPRMELSDPQSMGFTSQHSQGTPPNFRQDVTLQEGFNFPECQSEGDRSMDIPMNYKQHSPQERTLPRMELSDPQSMGFTSQHSQGTPPNFRQDVTLQEGLMVSMLNLPNYNYRSMRTSRVSSHPPLPEPTVLQRSYQRSRSSIEEENQSVSSSHSARLSRNKELNPFPQDERSKEVACDICNNRRAIKTCLTCNTSYCDEDILQHYKIPSLQRHKMVDITEEMDDKRCQHYHRNLDLYCKTDQMLICSLCSETSHQGHDFVLMVPESEQRQPWSDTGDGDGYVTALPPPGEIEIVPLTTDSVTVSWEPPFGPDIPRQFRIVWQCEGERHTMRVNNVYQVEVSELKLGRKYDFAVATEEENDKSSWVRKSFFTVIPPPTDFTIDHLNSTSITLRWTKDPKIHQIQQNFLISYGIKDEKAKIIHSKSCTKTLSDLRPDTVYVVSVSTLLLGGEQSEPECKTISTRSCLMGLLSNIGLSNHYEGKLKLSGVLEINSRTTSDEQLNTMQSLPGAFLKKLMLTNVDARSVRCVIPLEDMYETDRYETLESENGNINAINPLDLSTALFLCADGSLKQEMVRKMVLCQFAVPLLLPNCETKQTTLMLWALREVVKKFKPFTSTKPLVEESIVVSEIPLVSFVSMGKDSLNKYQILNRMQNNAFVHREMDCDDAPRKISDGLVEISWCLPCGNKSIDLFEKPVAVANMRGDIRSFQKQFSFLCDVSAAVYIFSDDKASSYNIIKGKDYKAQIIIVVDGQKESLRGSFRRPLQVTSNRPIKHIVKKKLHDADFVKNIIQSAENHILTDKPNIVTIEKMAESARHHGILVDEDSEECRKAQRIADKITSQITDTSNFKEENLPLQGIERQLSHLDEEKCKADSLELTALKAKEEKLIERLKGFKMKHAMEIFITEILDQSVECCSYFLQWMKMNLDNLSRQNLSRLREEYKRLLQSTPERKDLIADLDQKMSDHSLGLEHLFRELGLLYQWSKSEHAPLEDSPQKNQIVRLPQMYAQMLLEGLPIELVDGDTSNIPLEWITDVLTCLHCKVKTNSKIKVITVLGVQGTGKSTLINTMFGVQFAVSTGRCTRGAFMQFMSVNRELREELKCDFILIIDTEGLKAPELAQQNDSQEHDHKLATLVVGLSDVTIINMTMGVFSEMKGILQMVVCTLLGIQEKIKKPKCHFVHQNVSNMSPDANIRERKSLLEELDQMTLEAAKMANNAHITRFTDVMDYDPDTGSSYMPGLWHGIPPMAPVSPGYSEAVCDLRIRLIQDLQKCPLRGDLKDFLELAKSLGNCVKHQRSSCIWSRVSNTFRVWERTLNTSIDAWMERTVTEAQESSKNPEQAVLLKEAKKVLALAEKEILTSLEKFIKTLGCHSNIAQKIREEFTTKAKTLHEVTERKVRDKLQQALKRNEALEYDTIKSLQAFTLEKKVLDFLHQCKNTQSPFSDEGLKQELEVVWRKASSDFVINSQQVQRKDVAQEVAIMLRENIFSRHNTHCMTDEVTLQKCGREKFVVRSVGWQKKAGDLVKHGDPRFCHKKLTVFCRTVISQCKAFITETVEKEDEYSEPIIQELLQTIDKSVHHNKTVMLNEETEIALKRHICGLASTEFQRMHDNFRGKRDPQAMLEVWKTNYFEDFSEKVRHQDQLRKKARQLVNLCLKPAVMDYVNERTGLDIARELFQGMGSEDDNVFGALHYSILQHLLSDMDYEKYQQYIHDYNRFVKNWILDEIERKLSKANLSKIEKKHLTDVVNMITTEIINVKRSSGTHGEIISFIHSLHSALSQKLGAFFPKNALNSVMILDITYKEEFADHLTAYVKEIKQILTKEYETRANNRERLRCVLFKTKHSDPLLGCMEQCPFCKAPCEAGKSDHDQHFASAHRPQGLNGLQASKRLLTEACDIPTWKTSTLRRLSRSQKSNKQETSSISSLTSLDGSLSSSQASFSRNFTCGTNEELRDYWRFVMVTFNERWANDFGVRPAKLPESWKSLTQTDLLNRLERARKK